jgi:hypothetical protein
MGPSPSNTMMCCSCESGGRRVRRVVSSLIEPVLKKEMRKGFVEKERGVLTESKPLEYRV